MKNIDQMITEQVKAWSQNEAATGRMGVASKGPMITISREYGAQGALLAKVLGERLGFRVWDKDLLNAIAEEGGGDVRLLASLDEHHREAIDDAVNGLLRGSPHTNAQYFRALLRVVHTIAAHGKSIIVGRGANYMCPSSSVLRIRVVSPFAVRVRRMAERRAWTEREAQKEVERMDAERAAFVRYHFKRDVDMAADYDLVVNADTYTLEQVADLVEKAYAMKFKVRSSKFEVAH